MNTDKNTVIGFVLLAGLFFAYFWFTNKQQNELQAYKKHFDDSVAMVKATEIKAAAIKNAALVDSTVKTAVGDSSAIDTLKEQFVVIENELVKVTLTNKGGQVANVLLKKYTNSNKQQVVLGDSTSLNYPINIASNQSAQINQLIFQKAEVLPEENGVQKVAFTLTAPNGNTITHLFSLAPKQYNIDWTIQLNGADQLLTNHQLNVLWEAHTFKQERTLNYERQMSNICFSEGKEFDYISSKTTKTFEKPVQWVGLVQQFFNTTLISKTDFASGKIDWQRRIDSSNSLAALQTQLQTKSRW
jgi:YidC/Oxa1 family membrane protein insertase